MENICKIAKLFVTLSLCLISIHLYPQNRYDISNVYYNMDTANCLVIEQDNRGTINEGTRYILSDTSRLYRQVFKLQLSLPIIEVLDSSIILYIDTLVNESIEDGNVWSPDTSGICIVIDFSYENEQSMKLYISTIANYYLYGFLFPIGYEVLFEWFGRYNYTNVGCFFHNDILCIVRLHNVPITPQAQCYYTETVDSILINLFEDKVIKYHEEFNIIKQHIVPTCGEHIDNK